MLEYFSQTRTLVWSFIASVALFMAFCWVHAGVGDGPSLDTLLSGAAARDRLMAMSPAEIRHHLIGTATIDMLYPIAYGMFCAGALYRLGGAWKSQLALLPIFGAGFDLLENIVQISALAGGPDLLNAKIFLTGPKFVLVLGSIALITVLALAALVKRYRR